MNDATLIDRDGRPTLRFERQFAQPLERVWRAVTDEDEMRAWFPSAVQGERKVGAPLRFPFDENLDIDFEGRVTEWDPMQVFAFEWNGDDLRIELTTEGDATRMVFTHAVSDRSVAARNGSGWHMCLANLDAHLGGPPATHAWDDVYGDYLARMGPSLATPTRQWSLTWERAHHVTVDRMWECLTDPKELEAWMGYPVVVDLRLGGAIRFEFGGPDGPEEGVIVALDAPNTIAYTFGDTLSVVEWTVEQAEHGCRYRMTQHAMPEERAAGWGAGWHSFLLQLDMYAAAGQLIVDEHEPRIPAYQAILG